MKLIAGINETSGVEGHESFESTTTGLMQLESVKLSAFCDEVKFQTLP